ncbi:MAG: PHP-associated domain-containing protein [Candidatus Bipolaricaulaceae bacterium]
MRWFRADLHVHSVLSPCASLEMSPRRIVQEARRADLDLIAVCDHNAGANGFYARRLADGRPVVLVGMEVQSQEEVEVLTWFEDPGACARLARELADHLPAVPCRPHLFGDQLVVDEHDEIVARVDRLLLSPLDLPLDEVVRRAERCGGVAVPAHVDRVPGGLLAVLGFLPEGPWPQAVEISPWTRLSRARSQFPQLRGLPTFRSSDAHVPQDVGRAWTKLRLRAPTLDELVAALEGRGERAVCPGPAIEEGL